MTAASKKGSATGWIVFLATLLVLSFAAMPGFETVSRFADRALIAVRLSLVLALSVLVVREKFFAAGGAYDRKSLLQRARRWYYDQ
jgi:uncharacterized membrane protein